MKKLWLFFRGGGGHLKLSNLGVIYMHFRVSGIKPQVGTPPVKVQNENSYRGS